MLRSQLLPLTALALLAAAAPAPLLAAAALAEYRWLLITNADGLPVLSLRQGLDAAPPLAAQGLVSGLLASGLRAGIRLRSVAAEHDASMIVVGTRGESPLTGMLLGSTAYRLVHSSTIPVLIVPVRGA